VTSAHAAPDSLGFSVLIGHETSGRRCTLGYTLINLSKDDEPSEKSYWKLWLVGILAVLIACFLHWGGFLLVAGDSVPEHVDAAVVLQGSIASENARTAAAMALLQRGSANRVAVSVPRESYWDQEVPPIARPYLEKKYGAELAGRVDFCNTEPDITSAQQEAQALSTCIQEHGWKNIALLTSNYQSRRVGMIWRKTLPKGDPLVYVFVEGVPDPKYQPRGWWRQRLYVETWLSESAKLAWASL
jgi:uncharacterized SAM-binding protein YcdF (DUF218 family)